MEPIGGRPPEADTADMETYLENVTLLLLTLGVNALTGDTTKKSASASRPGELVLDLWWEDARAECAVRDGQFVVHAGSIARAKEVESLGDGTRALRESLMEARVLVTTEDGGQLRFAQDHAFESLPLLRA